MRWFGKSVFAIAGLAMSFAAASEVITFNNSNGWSAYGGTTDGGKKLCGLSASGGGRWLGIKYFYGESSLTVHLSNKKWTLRNRNSTSLSMQFDDYTEWTARATPFYMNDGDAALEFSIPGKNVSQFMSEFRRASYMYIRFQNSDVEDWRTDLSGSIEAANSLAKCMELLMN